MADTVFMSLPTPDVVREVALGGNGGLIETSGKRYLYIDAAPDASADRPASRRSP